MQKTMTVQSVRLIVEVGTAWVTRTGDGDDRFVGSGETLDLEGGGWVIGPAGSAETFRFTVTPLSRIPQVPSRMRTVAAWA